MSPPTTKSTSTNNSLNSIVVYFYDDEYIQIIKKMPIGATKSAFVKHYLLKALNIKITKKEK